MLFAYVVSLCALNTDRLVPIPQRQRNQSMAVGFIIFSIFVILNCVYLNMEETNQNNKCKVKHRTIFVTFTGVGAILVTAGLVFYVKVRFFNKKTKKKHFFILD